MTDTEELPPGPEDVEFWEAALARIRAAERRKEHRVERAKTANRQRNKTARKARRANRKGR